ncbi:MAG: hypothetical protein R3C53_28095 [Pirellulaceae bacterium]
MTQKRSTLGPRGWAILTLAGGAALSSPFLRPAQLAQPEPLITDPLPTAPVLAANYGPAPSFASQSSMRTGTTASIVEASSPATTVDVSAISNAQKVITSNQAALPTWAKKASPLDALIQVGPVAGEFTELASGALQPIQPWQSHGTTQDVLASGDDLSQLAAQRHSPWQETADLPAFESQPALATNWKPEKVDIAKLLNDNARNQRSNSHPLQAAPIGQLEGELVQPGGLARATLRRSTSSVANSATDTSSTDTNSTAPPSRGNFVFQPSLRP